MRIPYRKFVLLFVSLTLLIGFFLIPFNRNWLSDKIVRYYKEWPDQLQYLDIDTRWRYRYGSDYNINNQIKDYFENAAFSNPVIFLPPRKYLLRNIDKYDWKETLSFYYFTGVKAVHLDSKDYAIATHALLADRENFKIIEIEDKYVLERVVIEYSKFSD